MPTTTLVLLALVACAPHPPTPAPVNWGDVVSDPCTIPWPALDIQSPGLRSRFRSPDGDETTVLEVNRPALWYLIVRNSTAATISLPLRWSERIIVGALPDAATPSRFAACHLPDEQRLVDALSAHGCIASVQYASEPGLMTLAAGETVLLPVHIALGCEGQFKLAAWLRSPTAQPEYLLGGTLAQPSPVGLAAHVTVKREPSGAERAWLLFLEANHTRTTGDPAAAQALLVKAREFAPMSAFLASQCGAWHANMDELEAAIKAFGDCVMIGQVTGDAPDPLVWSIGSTPDACRVERDRLAALLASRTTTQPPTNPTR